jgi:hypothetical protein
MDSAAAQYEAERLLERKIELAQAVTGQDDSEREAFYREIDGWARHALAANGFGDY